MTRPRLAQLHPSGAADGDVSTYDAATDTWGPAAPGSAPTGTAGGDLAGTYPNPTIGSAGMEAIRDMLATVVTAGSGVTVTVDDALNTITIASTGGYTDEQVRDVMGIALVAGTGITITVNDGADTITITSSVTQYTDEMARDAIGAALVAGTGMTITVNDGADTITLASSGSYTDENARDAIGAALVAGTGITITVNDGADTITIDAAGGTTIHDRRWYCPASWSSIDEFNDDSLGGSWARVDKSGGTGRATWTEGADVLSAKGASGDSSAEYHAMMIPLSGFGGSMAVSDAIVGHLTLFAGNGVNLPVIGMAIADGVTYGSGDQVLVIHYPQSSGIMDVRGATGYSADTSAGGFGLIQGTPYFVRIARITSTTWRGDVSMDGVSWAPMGTVTKTFTPAHAGFVISSYGNSTAPFGSFEFLRRMTGVT